MTWLSLCSLSTYWFLWALERGWVRGKILPGDDFSMEEGLFGKQSKNVSMLTDDKCRPKWQDFPKMSIYFFHSKVLYNKNNCFWEFLASLKPRFLPSESLHWQLAKNFRAHTWFVQKRSRLQRFSWEHSTAYRDYRMFRSRQRVMVC